jgi:hypothetical protein
VRLDFDERCLTIPSLTLCFDEEAALELRTPDLEAACLDLTVEVREGAITKTFQLSDVQFALFDRCWKLCVRQCSSRKVGPWREILAEDNFCGACGRNAASLGQALLQKRHMVVIDT